MTEARASTTDQQKMELQTDHWLNAKEPLSLASMRGKVIAVHAFQMLCPACVSHGLPQMSRLYEAAHPRDLAVIGLHSVFEHHSAMNNDALGAFVHEYRLKFPIAVDRPAAAGPIPLTMSAWALEGTPSVLLFDRRGRLRLRHFGFLDDLRLGISVGQLIAERVDQMPGDHSSTSDEPPGEHGCNGSSCRPA